MYIYGALLAALFPFVSAVFADEAYEVDFHYALLGQPQASSTFFNRPIKGSKASLLYTLSSKSILGAVNPKDGAVLWRQDLSSNHSTDSGSAIPSEVHETIISASGSHLSSWGAADGRLAWENDFGDNKVSSLAVEQAPRRDVLAIVQASGSFKAYKFDGYSGFAKWTYEDKSGDIPFQILDSSTNIHLISLHSTMLKGLKLKVNSLDRESGKSIDQQTLSSDGEISSSGDIIYVGPAGNYQIIAWSDADRNILKFNVLGTKEIRSIEPSINKKQVDSITLHSSDQTTATPHILVHYQSNDAHWADVYELDGLKSNLRKVYSLPATNGHGSFSVSTIEGTDYFVRLADDVLNLFSSASAAPLASWPVNLSISGLKDRPRPVHATAEAVRTASGFAVRAAALLSSGDWVLIRNGDVAWSRPEALASVVDARWQEVVDNQELAHDLKTESSSNLIASFLHRVSRHLNDLKGFSSWLQSFVAFVGDPLGSHDTKGDSFGFSQVLVVETENGRLIALDVGDRGRIIWNKPKSEQAEQSSYNREDSEQNSVSDRAQTTYVIENGVLRGRKGPNTKHIWSFKPRHGYRIYSVTPQLKFEPVASIGKVLGDRRVLYKYLNPNAVLVMAVDDLKGKSVATLLDTVSGNILHSSEHNYVDTNRPIAAAISENWMAFSYTVDSPLDSVSKGYQLVMAEFYESDTPNDRGYFDIAANYSALRGSSPPSKPYVVSQSFHVPEEISKMAVTQTAQGITSRQLLVGLSGSHSIVGIPRQALDPRRTIGKDPTPAQLEEGLSRYTPMIDFDPKWYLNHQEEILGVREIITKPTLLESTSLVFAYGHDIFGTRIAPSFAFDILGKSFNKIQLVLTIVALLVGVFIVAPLIQRKQTNALWES